MADSDIVAMLERGGFRADVAGSDFQRVVRGFAKSQSEGKGLLLSGSTGRGKTLAMRCLFPATPPPRRDCKWVDCYLAPQVGWLSDRDILDWSPTLVLDDVGDPIKAPNLPPIEPTWKIETSKGSFQWGYAFSEQPTKGEYAAAIRAMADAGYTDPGACNPVRNFRLPGSVNLRRASAQRARTGATSARTCTGLRPSTTRWFVWINKN